MEPALLKQMRLLQTRALMQIGYVLRKQYESFVKGPLPPRLAALLGEEKAPNEPPSDGPPLGPSQ